MGWTSSLTAVATVILVASTVAADLLTASSGASNSSLLWGTYRPNLYFGTRPRIPESVMTGLMWFDANQFQGFQSMRFFLIFFCITHLVINSLNIYRYSSRL